MKRSLSILTVFFVVAMLSGCILSKTPSTDQISMLLGDQMTYSVNVFPTGGTFVWTLDDAPLSNTGNSYLYTALAGNHTLTVKATHAFGTDTQTWNIDTPNPPLAQTGPDQTVAEMTVVTLDASNSSDPDNDIISYKWEQTGGSKQVALSNPDAVKATFMSPDVDNNGDALTFKLTVTDSTGLDSTATCIVNVTGINDPPTAVAGPNQTVGEGTVVTLDASDSTDLDDGIASYLWEQIEGPSVTLSDASAVNPTFTAPNVGTDGAALTFKLTVTDNGGLKSTATCIVNVTWMNEPPQAITADQTVEEGVLVTLDGSASTDPDNGIASYAWQQTSGKTIILSKPGTAKPTFHSPQVGPDGASFGFKLTVTDRGGLKSTATCNVFVHHIDWSVMSTGAGYTIAIKIDGSLWAWGDNSRGQFGDGTTESKYIPTRIGTDTNWRTVSVADWSGITGKHIMAIKTDGSLWAWGDNDNGQLGDGSTIKKYVPTRIGTDNDWVAVSAGSNSAAQSGFTLALKSNGTLWAWGLNSCGQLGDGTTIDKYVPTQIGTNSDWVEISAGENHAVALKSNGSLWAWGDNSTGQIGDGTGGVGGDKLVPTKIGTSTDWITVTAGTFATFAIKSDTTLWAWGWNLNYGQLGDGTTTERYVPTQIGVDTGWAFVSAGQGESIAALKTDGSLWAWGYNYYGQVGDGTNIDKYVPTRVGIDNDWTFVNVGNQHTVAMKADGSYWAWGSDFHGGFGDGLFTDAWVPTRIF